MPRRRKDDDEKADLSLAPLDPVEALKALLKVKPEQDEEPSEKDD